MQQQSSILNYFWDLVSIENDVAEKAARGLLEDLKGQLQQSKSKPMPADIKYEQLEEYLPNDLVYSLNRLVKGLSSARKAARQGFASTLTALLSELLPGIKASLVLDLIDQHSAKKGSMKGYEERDLLYGKLFGFAALIRAGNLSSEAATVEDVAKVAKELLKVAIEKPYLRELCFQLVYSLADKLLADGCEDKCKKLVAELEKDEYHLFTKGKETFPGFLPVILLLQKNAVVFGFEVMRLGMPNNAELLHSDNFKLLAQILKESAHVHPCIHSCWDFIIEELASKNNSGLTEAFWTVVVEDTLVAAASVERKFLALSVFLKFLERLADPSIILTPRIVNCFLASAADETQTLHEFANKNVPKLLQVAADNKEIGLRLMACLTAEAKGRLNQLKKLVGNKELLDSIMNCVGEEKDLVQYAESLISSFFDTATEQHQRVCLEQLLAVFKNKKLCKSDSLIKQILQFIASISFFQVEGKVKTDFFKSEVAISSPVRDYASQCFWRVLFEVSKVDRDSLVAVQAYQVLSDLERKPEFKVKCGEWDAEIDGILKKCRSIFKAKTDDQVLVRLKQLIAVFYIQLKTTEDEDFIGELAGSLEELSECFERIHKKTEGELDPFSVITDVLLASYADLNLEKNMKLIKLLSENLFYAYAPRMKEDGVALLCRSIDPVFDLEEEEEEAEKEQDNEEGSKDESEHEHEHEHGSDCDHHDHGHDVPAPMDVSEDEEIIEREEEDEESDLDDDDMYNMGFNEKLQEIFRQQKLDKKDKQIKKRSVVNFRFRVLDLIETYLKHAIECKEYIPTIVGALVESLIVHNNPNLAVNKGEKSVAIKKFKNQLRIINDIPPEQRVALVNRLVGVLKGGCVKAIKEGKSEDSKELIDQLLFSLVSKRFYTESEKPSVGMGKNKNISKAIEEVFLAALKSFSGSKDLMAELVSLCVKKNSHVFSLLEEIIKRRVFNTEECFEYLIQSLVTLLTDAELQTKDFNKDQMMKLISIYVKITSGEELKQYTSILETITGEDSVKIEKASHQKEIQKIQREIFKKLQSGAGQKRKLDE